MGTVTSLPSKARPALTPPAPLTPEHDIQQFNCGREALDDWLRYRAIKAEARSARTYVTCIGGNAVVGYYCFAAGGVRIEELPKKQRRNMPPIVPVTILGRLAVDARYHGLGIGRGLLKDALSRALHASRIIGSAAVIVHAIDEQAAAFYTAFGFQRFPEGSRTFFVPTETILSAAT